MKGDLNMYISPVADIFTMGSTVDASAPAVTPTEDDLPAEDF